MNEDWMPEGLAQLNRLPIWGAAVTGDMLTLQFGMPRERVTRRGDSVSVGEYALHIQCLWRFVTDDRVLVGSDDCSIANEGSEFSEIITRVRHVLGSEPRNCVIRRSRSSDLLILIDSDLSIEVIAAAGIHGSEMEAWRVLAEPRHFVAMFDGSRERDGG